MLGFYKITSHTTSNLAHKNGNGKVFYYLCAIVLFVFCNVVPASAQYMGYGIRYKDMWVVGYNQPYDDGTGTDTWVFPDDSPSAWVHGYASYEDSYNTNGHTYTITTTISNPDLNSLSNTVNSESGGVRSDVEYEYDIDGVYNVDDEVLGYCPIANSEFNNGAGPTDSKELGVAYGTYRRGVTHGLTITYNLSGPCNAYCTRLIYKYSLLNPIFGGGTPKLWASIPRLYEITRTNGRITRRACTATPTEVTFQDSPRPDCINLEPFTP